LRLATEFAFAHGLDQDGQGIRHVQRPLKPIPFGFDAQPDAGFWVVLLQAVAKSGGWC